MFLNASRRLMGSVLATPGKIGAEITACLWIGCTLFTIVTSQDNFYTNGRYGKRQDHEQAPSAFWSGSRYGRSGVPLQTLGKVEAEDVAKDVEVSPRTDRFFLGSRYGKRNFANDRRVGSLNHFETSDDFLISVDQETIEKKQIKIPAQEDKKYGNFISLRSNEKSSSPINERDPRGGAAALSRVEEIDGIACFYTGFKNFYRCYNRKNGNALRISTLD